MFNNFKFPVKDFKDLCSTVIIMQEMLNNNLYKENTNIQDICYKINNVQYSLKSLQENWTNYRKECFIESIKLISIITGICVTIIFIIYSITAGTLTNDLKYSQYIKACSNSEISMCSEGISFYPDLLSKKELVLAYYNRTGKKLNITLNKED